MTQSPQKSSGFLGTLISIFEVIEIIGLFLIIPIYAGYVELITYLVDKVDIANMLYFPDKLGGIDTSVLLKTVLYPLLGFYVILRLRYRLRKSRQERAEFMAVSKVTDATILNATQIARGTSSPHALLHLKVHAAPEFETYVEIRINLFNIPKKGDTLKVRYNPQNHDQLELADGTPTTAGRGPHQRAAMMEKMGRF